MNELPLSQWSLRGKVMLIPGILLAIALLLRLYASLPKAVQALAVQNALPDAAAEKMAVEKAVENMLPDVKRPLSRRPSEQAALVEMLSENAIVVKRPLSRRPSEQAAVVETLSENATVVTMPLRRRRSLPLKKRIAGEVLVEKADEETEKKDQAEEDTKKKDRQQRAGKGSKMRGGCGPLTYDRSNCSSQAPSSRRQYTARVGTDWSKCKGCDGSSKETCGICATMDHMSCVLGMHYVDYQRGTPRIFGNRTTLKDAKTCYRSCGKNPMIDRHYKSGPVYGTYAEGEVGIPHLYDSAQLAPFNASSVECNKVAMVQLDVAPHIFYHYVLERIYETYTFWGVIAYEHGCPKEEIDIAVYGFESETKYPFARLWQSVLPRRPYKTLNGCYKAVYYGVPWGTRVSERFGRTFEFSFNVKRSVWASLWSLRVRSKYGFSNAVKQHESMLVLFHHRSPKWWDKLNFDFDGVKHNYQRFRKNTPLAEQISHVSNARGIISGGGAGFTWQIFLSPRSSLFILNLEFRAQNPSSTSRTAEGACSVHDIWGAHLGHSVLSWVWGDPQPFHAIPSVTRSLAIQALRFLLDRSNIARDRGISWICHIFRRSSQKKIEPLTTGNVSLKCDVEFDLPDADVELLRNGTTPPLGSQAQDCGRIGAIGPPILAPWPDFFKCPSTMMCIVRENCNTHKSGRPKRIRWPSRPKCLPR